MSDAGSEQELDLSNVRVVVWGGTATGRNEPAARSANSRTLTLTRAPSHSFPQSDVVTKYKAAAEIANGEEERREKKGFCFLCSLDPQSANDLSESTRPPHALTDPPFPNPPLSLTHTTAALKAVIEECKPGAKLVDVCAKGDAVIEE